MRINFSSKTKGSRKITPFYTIKAGKKSAFGDANRKCWSKRGTFSMSAMWSWDSLLYFAGLIQRHREAASSRRSFRAGIDCRLICGNDLGEPSQLHIVRTCSYHDCDVGPFGSLFLFFFHVSSATETDINQAPRHTIPIPRRLYLAIQARCLPEPDGEPLPRLHSSFYQKNK